jgi:hypothetical protein
MSTTSGIFSGIASSTNDQMIDSNTQQTNILLSERLSANCPQSSSASVDQLQRFNLSSGSNYLLENRTISTALPISGSEPNRNVTNSNSLSTGANNSNIPPRKEENEKEKELRKINLNFKEEKVAEKFSHLLPSKQISLIKQEFSTKYPALNFLTHLENKKKNYLPLLICYNIEHENKFGELFEKPIYLELLDDEELGFIFQGVTKKNNPKDYNIEDREIIIHNFRMFSYAIQNFHLYIQVNIFEKYECLSEGRIFYPKTSREDVANGLGDWGPWTKDCTQNYNAHLKLEQDFIENFKKKFRNYSEIYEQIDKRKLSRKIKKIFRLFGPINPSSLQKLFSCTSLPNVFNPDPSKDNFGTLKKICRSETMEENEEFTSLWEISKPYIKKLKKKLNGLKIFKFKFRILKTENEKFRTKTKYALYKCAYLMANAYRKYKMV